MLNKKTILVLYTELASYTIKCFSTLANEYDVNIHILRMPINAVAPFSFANIPSNIRLYNAIDFNFEKIFNLYNDIKPDLVYCAGWTQRVYIELCKKVNNECATLIGFDTQWNGSLKQLIGSFIFKMRLKQYFQYAFVPGAQQAKLAERMGFSSDKIIKGAYSADIELFESANEPEKLKKRNLLFIGRYESEKGIQLLCDAFTELLEEGELTGWNLLCVGKGSFSIPKKKFITDLGFQQPDQLIPIMRNASIFILPSSYEPWGVVLHESVAAGFPLICSDKVGAREAFLKDNENGYVFQSGNKKELKKAICNLCNLDNASFTKMSEKSQLLAKSITPSSWANSIYNILN